LRILIATDQSDGICDTKYMTMITVNITYKNT